MRFVIEKNRLLQIINVVSKGMSSRSTLPVFSGIYIETTIDGVIFQTTDLEISIKHIAEALIEQRGATVVPGKLFSDIIKSLPEAAITLEQKDNTLLITCLDSSFSITTMDPVDYPSFPSIVTERSLQLPTKVVAEAVKKVYKAVSRDESRAVLTGIYLKAEEKTLQLVATDSYRLAVSRFNLDEALGETLDLIVPGAIFEEVSRLANEEEKLLIGESENQILFKFGTTTFVSRKIEGSYPNYEQIIPQQRLVSVKLNTAELYEAVRRAAVLAQAHGSVRFIVDPDGQLLEITTQSQEVGSSAEKLNATVEGEGLEIGFNHQYIMDGLAAIDTDEVLFEAQTSLKPGIFKTIDSDYYFYLTMPVRLD
ncbi:MAG: DNA polymerase III subunit beta [Coriobacteriia bacterium]|nr:DNA polymerase III subunit beta [Coriobacteriia bacterium]